MKQKLLFILGLFVLISCKCNNADISKIENIQQNSKGIIDKTWVENYNAIMLYRFIKEGINKDNILSDDTKFKIQSILTDYHDMYDFDTADFYKRESASVDKVISKQEFELYMSCINDLSFEDVVSTEELEEDWRYPLNQIKSLKKVLELYRNDTLEDGIFTVVPYFHAYLYMYFSSRDEKERIKTEIAYFKQNHKKQ